MNCTAAPDPNTGGPLRRMSCIPWVTRHRGYETQIVLERRSTEVDRAPPSSVHPKVESHLCILEAIEELKESLNFVLIASLLKGFFSPVENFAGMLPDAKSSESGGTRFIQRLRML